MKNQIRNNWLVKTQRCTIQNCVIKGNTINVNVEEGSEIDNSNWDKILSCNQNGGVTISEDNKLNMNDNSK